MDTKHYINNQKRYFKTKIFSLLRMEWNHQQSKVSRVKNSTIPWIPPLNLSREEKVKLLKLKIGHTYITSSYMLLRQNPPRCVMAKCRRTTT